ncbi:hypothetical protein KM043_000351 [Ampulex compressa]|nr:hypothetical protein KM043_000351 [Ampulex compressa]
MRPWAGIRRRKCSWKCSWKWKGLKSSQVDGKFQSFGQPGRKVLEGGRKCAAIPPAETMKCGVPKPPVKRACLGPASPSSRAASRTPGPQPPGAAAFPLSGAFI